MNRGSEFYETACHSLDALDMLLGPATDGAGVASPDLHAVAATKATDGAVLAQRITRVSSGSHQPGREGTDQHRVDSGPFNHRCTGCEGDGFWRTQRCRMRIGVGVARVTSAHIGAGEPARV